MSTSEFLPHETPELEIYQRKTHMRSEDVPRRGRLASRLVHENASMAEIGCIIGSTLAIEDVYERFAD